MQQVPKILKSLFLRSTPTYLWMDIKDARGCKRKYSPCGTEKQYLFKDVLGMESVIATKTHDGCNNLFNSGIFHRLFDWERAFRGLSYYTNRQQCHNMPMHIHTEAPCTAMRRL